ncbi:MAG: ATP-binding protein [Acidimicrobiia bacterium]|nr:ATP-binding protein [Acidimicrobiia bacterium]MCY4433202.1 sensor histidine kinase [bacterium]
MALVELVKNAYDADASRCTLRHEPGSILVSDNGHGMTLHQFRTAWMRVGTSSKESTATSRRFGREITGEKGIGRFAVRFLGPSLDLESIAYDEKRGEHTRLRAQFDWPEFDRHEDIGHVQVPYELETLEGEHKTGTTLTIGGARDLSEKELRAVRTASVGLLSPMRPLFRKFDSSASRATTVSMPDPGFTLEIQDEDITSDDVAASVLENFVVRAELKVTKTRVILRAFRRGESKPYLEIKHRQEFGLGSVYADVRFFPRRSGTFRGTGIDGKVAYSWIKQNAGVAVFDRAFRVQPYGADGDDWLSLQADVAIRKREPRSLLARKYFPMSDDERSDTQLNWMLRLPQSAQVVGVVEVRARRDGGSKGESDLVPAADREGFIDNVGFRRLRDLVRGALEAIAYVDRATQLEEQAQAEAMDRVESDAETRRAIDAIQTNPSISAPQKRQIVAALKTSQGLLQTQAETARERERQLEVMSLLGVVAGFMTHEFGVAVSVLQAAQRDLEGANDPSATKRAARLANSIKTLQQFATYASGYIQGSKTTPDSPYKALPRFRQIAKVFGPYAAERDIAVKIDVEKDVDAPLVPPSLYNGIAQNLLSNALKATTANPSSDPQTVAFRAWNERSWHTIEVSDTGVGIDDTLRDRVFDPLFTTTSGRSDLLGSGMGLGLTLVRRGAEAYDGSASVVDPPPGFNTCIQVRIPLVQEGS